MIVGRAAVQKDLGRLEKWACRYCMKSNTVWGRVLHVG